jgi:hypothetical protein
LIKSSGVSSLNIITASVCKSEPSTKARAFSSLTGRVGPFSLITDSSALTATIKLNN